MIKAIFFDIDGTLVSHKTKSVPQSTRDALAILREKGIKTIVASGRTLLEFPELPIRDLKFDGYLTLTGQLCYDADFNLISENHIKDKPIIDKLFNEKTFCIEYVEEHRKYINFLDDRAKKALIDVSTQPPDILEKAGSDPLYQGVVYADEKEEEELRKLLPNSKLTRWHPFAIDIISKDGGKEAGIEGYIKQHGISRDEIMAFGDGENDMDMLSYAGIGVAMGNASDYVKTSADYVTTDIDNDGVWNALKHFEII